MCYIPFSFPTLLGAVDVPFATFLLQNAHGLAQRLKSGLQLSATDRTAAEQVPLVEQLPYRVEPFLAEWLGETGAADQFLGIAFEVRTADSPKTQEQAAIDRPAIDDEQADQFAGQEHEQPGKPRLEWMTKQTTAAVAAAHSQPVTIHDELRNLIPRSGRWRRRRTYTRRRILAQSWFYFPCLRAFAFLIRVHRFWPVRAFGRYKEERLWLQRGRQRLEFHWHRGKPLFFWIIRLKPGYEHFPGGSPGVDLERELDLVEALGPIGFLSKATDPID